MDTSIMAYPFGRCWKCGSEFNSELRNEYNITHCHYCGEKIDDIFVEGANTADHYCDDCGLRICDQSGSWITRDKNPKQSGVCSGPCERELCAHCGDWDDEGECPKCHIPGCNNCPVENCLVGDPRICKNPCQQCTMGNDCLTDHTDKRDECESFRKFKSSLPQYRDEVKTGWWKVIFNLHLDGEEVRFEDLSETSQEHILNSIRDGCNQGQLVDYIEDESNVEEETAQDESVNN